MANEKASPGPIRRGFSTGRLEAFSDGVFAIAITLLVLDIAVPASAERHLLRSVVDLWPSYLAYVVSFSTIGAMWLGHNAITEYLDHSDSGLVRLNLLFLLFVAFLLLVLWRYAVRVKLVRPEAADDEVQLLTQRLTPGLASYLVLIIAGIFVPTVAVIGYFAIALFYIIPVRDWRRALRLGRQSRRSPRP